MHRLFGPWLEALAARLGMRRLVHALRLRPVAEALLRRGVRCRCDPVARSTRLLTGDIGRLPEAAVAMRVLHRVANGIGSTRLRRRMTLGDVRLARTVRTGRCSRAPAVRRLRVFLHHLRREVRALHMGEVGTAIGRAAGTIGRSRGYWAMVRAGIGAGQPWPRTGLRFEAVGLAVVILPAAVFDRIVAVDVAVDGDVVDVVVDHRAAGDIGVVVVDHGRSRPTITSAWAGTSMAA